MIPIMIIRGASGPTVCEIFGRSFLERSRNYFVGSISLRGIASSPLLPTSLRPLRRFPPHPRTSKSFVDICILASVGALSSHLERRVRRWSVGMSIWNANMHFVDEFFHDFFDAQPRVGLRGRSPSSGLMRSMRNDLTETAEVSSHIT